MADIERINQLISDITEKGRASKPSLQEKIYRDEPILKRASQLDNYIPEAIREMRKLSAGGMYHPSEESIFYKQAKYMEHYTDDFVYQGEFSRYFPKYQDMNNSQLRGYFSWRTKVRQGVIVKTELSFAFVYIYELLHGIGVADPESGFRALKEFYHVYGELDDRVCRYLSGWIRDYVIYYGLPQTYLAELPGGSYEQSLQIALHPEAHTEKELLDALSAMATYRLNQSKFYTAYPEDTEAVVARVYGQLAAYHEKRRSKSLYESLYGNRVSCSCTMFAAAVFYDRKRYRDYTYRVNEIQTYRCRNGFWTREGVFGAPGGNKTLGELLKTIDSMLRTVFSFPYHMKQPEISKAYSKLIEKVIAEYQTEKARKAVPRIEIDLSKLQGIRQAADAIRDRLIVEEEPEEEPSGTVEQIVGLPEGSATEIPSGTELTLPQPEEDCPLNMQEWALMRQLLYGEDYRAVLAQKGILLSVLVDGINEKLFDHFGDTVLLFGDAPELVEDYVEELKGMIPE